MEHPKVDYAKYCNCALPAINGNWDCCINCPNNVQLNNNTTITYVNEPVYNDDEWVKVCEGCDKTVVLFDGFKYCPYCGNTLD